MNLHLGQDETSRAEVEQLMLVPRLLVSPQANKPVIGLVQDSLLAVRLFTERDVLFARDEAMQLVAWLAHHHGDTLRADTGTRPHQLPVPAVLRPRALWSGKQLVSLALPRSLLVAANNGFRPDDERARDPLSPSDTYVVVRDGALLAGVLDRRMMGAAHGSIVHRVHNDEGAAAAARMLDRVRMMLTEYMRARSYSIGMSDVVASAATRAAVRDIVRDTEDEVRALVAQRARHEIAAAPGRTVDETLEARVNTALNRARDTAGRHAHRALDARHNRISRMVQAGSKGSETNIAQMMATIGQQNVNGQRIAYGFRERTLPHVPRAYTEDVRSRGFVAPSYVDGLDPMGFFMHAMGGREGLIDTAVKTSSTGYIQRRLMKAMEDLVVAADGSVRNSVGQVVQTLYGEDGLDGTGIERQPFALLALDDAALRRRYDLLACDGTGGGDDVLARLYGAERARALRADARTVRALRAEVKRIRAHRDTARRAIARAHGGATAVDDAASGGGWPLCANVAHVLRMAQRRDTEYAAAAAGEPLPPPPEPLALLRKLDAFWRRVRTECVPPAARTPAHDAQQRQATLLYMALVASHLSPRAALVTHALRTERAIDWALDELATRHRRARIACGEAVGPVAAQSLGEPSMQMTLNTFHSAGISGKNVTLGVPRMEELIKASRKIKTPSLSVYFEPWPSAGDGGDGDGGDAALAGDPELAEAERVRETAAALQCTTLADVVVRAECAVLRDAPAHTSCLARDRAFVERAAAQDACDGDDDASQQRPLSEWVVRIVLDRVAMVERDLSVSAVARALRLRYGGAQHVHLVHSDDNDDGRCVDDEEDDDDDDDEPMPGPRDGGVLRLRAYADDVHESLEATAPPGTLPDGRPVPFGAESDFALPAAADDAAVWRARCTRAFCDELLRDALGTSLRGVDGVRRVAARRVARAVVDECNGSLRRAREWVLETDGANLLGVLGAAGVDARRTASNHPIEVLGVLGVEAARACLLRELRHVLSFDGSYVNYRHLALLCDVMTLAGEVMPINRHALNRRLTGPLMRCTFEESIEVLTEASAFGERDEVRGVSERLVVGRHMAAGTGGVDLLPDVAAMLRAPAAETAAAKGDGAVARRRRGGDEAKAVAHGTNPFAAEDAAVVGGDAGARDDGDEDREHNERVQRMGRAVVERALGRRNPFDSEMAPPPSEPRTATQSAERVSPWRNPFDGGSDDGEDNVNVYGLCAVVERCAAPNDLDNGAPFVPASPARSDTSTAAAGEQAAHGMTPFLPVSPPRS